jgi:hypothetical protein
VNLLLIGRVLSALADSATVALTYLLARRPPRGRGAGAPPRSPRVLHVQSAHFYVVDVCSLSRDRRWPLQSGARRRAGDGRPPAAALAGWRWRRRPPPGRCCRSSPRSGEASLLRAAQHERSSQLSCGGAPAPRRWREAGRPALPSRAAASGEGWVGARAQRGRRTTSRIPHPPERSEVRARTSPASRSRWPCSP